ncbi:MAG: heavy metal translocating P-type ATPase [Halobacteriales archaeon]
MTMSTDSHEEIRLAVPGMDCASCAGTVGDALEGVSGVVACDTLPAAGRVIVTYDPGTATPETVIEAIEAAGYAVTESDADTEEAPSGDVADRRSVWRSRRAVATAAGGVVLLAGMAFEFPVAGERVVGSALGTAFTLADVLFLFAVVLSGRAIFRGGYRSARAFDLDIDLLMSIAVLGAIAASVGFGESLYFEAATLSVLFGIAELLEEYAMDRARASLRELVDLAPEEATVRRDTGSPETPRADGDAVNAEEVTVPASEVRAGETVVVRPGEKIPVDGEIVAGESAVNQAPITGESVPVDKTVGETVFAGTITESGYLEVEATADGTDTTLSRIVELVEGAEAKQTEREQFVDRFAGYYTPVVVALAVLLALVPPLAFGAAWPTYVVYGLTLLVLACPCAFVISTPVSVVSGITSAARNGVLIEGGIHLESMGEVDAVAFDKTGTLTEGELAVTDVIPLSGNTEADVLRCARGIERRSEHPIGEAIVDHAGDVVDASEADGDDPAIEEFEALSGEGVRADLDGVTHYAGKPGLFEALGFDLSHVHATTDGGVVTRTATRLCERNDCLDLLAETVPDLQAEGKTVVLVGTGNELEGVIALGDTVRPVAAGAIERLEELGVEHTVMLTGDNERTARAIAEEVGVDDYRAELLPDEKVGAIEDLREKYGGVAMVGDGVNDAPALATATVGIAMGAAGSDTALETADVALLSDDLAKLPYLYELAGRADGVIRGNVWASLAAKALLAAGVPFGLVPIWLAVLAGDAGMTAAVTGNAMRLSRVEPDTVGGTDR